MALQLPSIVVEFNAGISVASHMQDAYKTICYVGTSTEGDLTKIKQFSNTQSIADEYGAGPLVEALQRDLYHTRTPVYGLRAETVTAGSIETAKFATSLGGSPTSVPNDVGVIGFTGSPTVGLEPLVEVLTGGDHTVVEFRYSLDNGMTWYDPVIPNGTSFVVPGVGVTITLDDSNGDFVEGHVFYTRTAGPKMDVAKLQAALTIAATQTDYSFGMVAVVQGWSASDLASALTVAETAAESAVDYVNLWTVCLSYRELATDETLSAWRTEALGLSYSGGSRVAKFFGESRIYDPITNRYPRALAMLPELMVLSASELKQPVMQIILGPIPWVIDQYYFAEKQDSLYSKKWIIPRKYVGFDGWYVAGGLLATPNDSKLTYFWMRRTIDAVQERFQRFAPYVLGQLAQANGTKLTEQSAKFWAKRFEDQAIDLVDGLALISLSVSCSNSTVDGSTALLVVDWEATMGTTIGKVTIRGTLTF